MTQTKSFYVIISNVDDRFYARAWDKYSPWVDNLELADKFHTEHGAELAITRDGIDRSTVDIVPVRVTYDVIRKR